MQGGENNSLITERPTKTNKQDQPAGTGFSFVNQHDDARELTDIADQVVIFLANLYKVFPEFKTMDVSSSCIRSSCSSTDQTFSFHRLISQENHTQDNIFLI